MKKITVILLFVCLTIPFLGTYTWLQYKKYETKEMVKRHILTKIDKKELVTLKLSKSEAKTELHWEHDREFEYKGQMYDIVETQQQGDSIFYHCWWDHQETALNLQLQQIVDRTLGNDPQNHTNQENLRDFYKSLYYDTHQTQFLLLYNFCSQNLKSPLFYRKTIYLPVYNTPLSPPPEMGS